MVPQGPVSSRDRPTGEARRAIFVRARRAAGGSGCSRREAGRRRARASWRRAGTGRRSASPSRPCRSSASPNSGRSASRPARPGSAPRPAPRCRAGSAPATPGRPGRPSAGSRSIVYPAARAPASFAAARIAGISVSVRPGITGATRTRTGTPGLGQPPDRPEPGRRRARPRLHRPGELGVQRRDADVDVDEAGLRPSAAGGRGRAGPGRSW